MVTKTLPENYRLAEKISIATDKKLAIGLNVTGFLVTVALLIFFFAIFIADEDGTFSFTIGLLPILVVIIGAIAVVVIHELVHGIFIKHYTKEPVKYAFHGFAASAGSPDHYFGKKEYIIIALAPFIIVNAALIAALFSLHGTWFAVMYFVFAIHFTGCIADLYMVWKLRHFGPDTLIRDVGIEMEFFTS